MVSIAGVAPAAGMVLETQLVPLLAGAAPQVLELWPSQDAWLEKHASKDRLSKEYGPVYVVVVPASVVVSLASEHGFAP